MRLFIFLGFIFFSISGFSQIMTVSMQFNKEIEMQREAIYLSNYLSNNSLADTVKQQITTAGLHLMYEKEEIQIKLYNLLANDYQNISTFLNFLEDTTDIWDVDKLVFLELLNDLAAINFPQPDISTRIRDDLSSLHQIQNLYNEEMLKVFGKFETRAFVVRRKMWNEYVQFLQKRYLLQSILSNYNFDFGKTENIPGDTRSGSSSISGFKMPAKTVVLTFDDGPNSKYTPKTVEILKRKGAPAIFFELGDNVGSKDANNNYTPKNAAQYSIEIANSTSFLLGNHTMTHPLLTKLDSLSIETEITGGFSIIEKIASDTTTLFRPPFGAVNRTIQNVLAHHNSKPFLWNIDSRDWADPIPASIANRVVNEAILQGRGVILMHDIHQKTIESLELIIDTLRSKGFEFVLWDGAKLLNRNDSLLASRGEMRDRFPNITNTLYRKKWALIIGINDYKEWPKLQYAVNDARGVKKVLIDKLEFNEENILELENENATRKNILQAFGDQLMNQDKIKEDDAVFIFYAGHGMTRMVNDKRALGYIVPVDADRTSYSSQTISMSEINDLNEMIPARHVFWVMDACYSGLALTRSGSSGIDSKRYFQEVTNRKARQIITAGGADEEVADGGPNGHSIFTWSLINALSGDADINGDGYITASEICNYVPPNVSSLSKQTPAYGNLIGSSGGDFIFQLKPEEGDLNESTGQHDDATSTLLQQIAELRAQLALMENKLQSKESKSPDNTLSENYIRKDSVLSLGELNSLGLNAYRQKNYDLALQYFLLAVKINPSAIQPINNLGFIYYKIGKYDEALQWIQKALEISPNRMVAYLNLADVQLVLGDTIQAIENYSTYLSKAKESDFTKELQNKLNELKSR
jgi:peptidoglycan/xylan/chitin deacetylase (PgdA/CDA1 family)